MADHASARTLTAWAANAGAGAPRPADQAVTPAYVEACLLLALGEGPGHGYELKRELDELGLEASDRGRIYRTLRGMEAAGLVTSSWDTASAGPARRTYLLTPAGAGQLQVHAAGVRRRRRELSRFLARYDRVGPAAGVVPLVS